MFYVIFFVNEKPDNFTIFFQIHEQYFFKYIVLSYLINEINKSLRT